MKILPVVSVLLIALTTQCACLSSRDVQEGLVLIEQSQELASENTVDVAADGNGDAEEPDENEKPANK